MKKVAILASYNGSGFNALHEASQKKELDIEIVLVISNNPDAIALQNATKHKINNFIVNAKTDENPDKKIEQLLKEYKCEYLFLSGYMKKLSPNVTDNFKVINSHPALLPKYGGKGMYGHFVHEAVVKGKEKESGVTIHVVNENYDDGEIILQKRLTLNENETPDSLESKVKQLELIAIVEAFKKYLK
ncbi:MAG: phosphoribosylglycinamide formyltransferase [Sulfurimonas sp. RIFOXYD12_FULL_33_39]|uniref:phosphoribosylglycinamide formyltransferase n=1 Tax=unclassified Sulfurimonas TaxID=2623549 RepID=UPI0008D0634F|nr:MULTISPECIES: phosphoribosylglycinamide formyltransferase [unclassified Sulfurimonas]OHE06536.1 MAG: phosphoribosylglycinamide formyltransferase [Sulfurimonas sp. RIFCSPLOWO2_12_FULL_34_6]OHE08715.1 MAG: phosphoribosylglycinamide formyltransferase [Sulfurimonas sp. RIFOXYD12_FULL_33_39]OHE14000.1 MAG: phosphoribosylglycinamide formyltransferase [Sulfurimonas sp. RIFOXYD2_FULL_34_21]DAB27593.1 MAG TPA: phosphoribosylglycinamide formyltransferase [Sulfurimonas sp. UBA10385]